MRGRKWPEMRLTDPGIYSFTQEIHIEKWL